MPRHPPCALFFLTGNIYSYLILLGSNGIVTANLWADEIPYAGIFGFPKIIAFMPCSSFCLVIYCNLALFFLFASQMSKNNERFFLRFDVFKKLTVTFRNFSRFLRKLWKIMKDFQSFTPRLWAWWRWRDSNSWPPACKAGALPTELHPHVTFKILLQSFSLFQTKFFINFLW